MSPSVMRAVIPPSAPASAAADLVASRAAPGRGIGTPQQGGQAAQAPTDSAGAQAPVTNPMGANTDSPDVSAGASAVPATFGQTLAASKAKPAAPARGTARKSPAPPSVSPEMVLASLPGVSAPATAAAPASENAPAGNSAAPEAAASTNAATAGTADPAAGANALQSLSLMLGDDAASEPPALESDGGAPTAAASDSASPPGGAPASKAAAVLTPTPAASALMAHGFQTPGDPSGGPPGNDSSASPGSDTAATLRSDTAALASETAHPRIEQLSVAAASPGTSGDSALSGSPAATPAMTAVASNTAAPQATSTFASEAPAGPTVQVQAPVGSSGWAHEVGMRLHMLAQQGISSASLRLTPAQLGPVEVKISMHENAASVWFGAAQPETRSALESSLPKLRDLFASQGLNLAQAGVSDQSARGARREPQPAVAVAPSLTRAANATHVTSVQPVRQGLLDLYA